MKNSPIVPPGGQFVYPSSSPSQPLLSFQCSPIFKPYLDGESTAGFVVDTVLTHTGTYGATPYTFSSNSQSGQGIENLLITISSGNQKLVSTSIPLNTTGHEISFSLTSSGLHPQKAGYDITCTAQSDSGQTFHALTQLHYLPPNPNAGGNIVKLDLRTGGLLVQTRNGPQDGNIAGGQVAGAPNGWESLFALGFYTSFDNYIATNLSILNDVKDRGYDFFCVIYLVTRLIFIFHRFTIGSRHIPDLEYKSKLTFYL